MLTKVAPQGKASAKMGLDNNGKSNGEPPAMPFKIQVALNTSIDVFVFAIPVSFSILLIPGAACSQADFNSLMSRPNQVSAKDSFPTTLTEDQIKKKMQDNNVNFVFSQRNESAGFSRF